MIFLLWSVLKYVVVYIYKQLLMPVVRMLNTIKPINGVQILYDATIGYEYNNRKRFRFANCRIGIWIPLNLPIKISSHSLILGAYKNAQANRNSRLS